MARTNAQGQDSAACGCFPSRSAAATKEKASCTIPPTFFLLLAPPKLRVRAEMYDARAKRTRFIFGNNRFQKLPRPTHH